jgi:phosphoribosylanthranilate isomerase
MREALRQKPFAGAADGAVTVKICGVTSTEDAVACVDAGADAIGVNFSRQSPRYCERTIARAIVGAVADRALVVGVFVDASLEEIESCKRETGIACAQLSGDEPPDLVEQLLPHAYKAVRVRDASSIANAHRYPGEYILLDAYVPGVAGGTGTTFSWALAVDLARERRVAIAGGLTPENVARAVAEVRPYCVDVASGVESAPGRKDLARVRAFVTAAKGVPLVSRARAKEAAP